LNLRHTSHKLAIQENEDPQDNPESTEPREENGLWQRKSYRKGTNQQDNTPTSKEKPQPQGSSNPKKNLPDHPNGQGDREEKNNYKNHHPKRLGKPKLQGSYLQNGSHKQSTKQQTHQGLPKPK